MAIAKKKKSCGPGMKCSGVGVSKVSSGGRSVAKKRKVQAKVSSDYKAKQAAKPRRAKFSASKMKKGGSVKKKKK